MNCDISNIKTPNSINFYVGDDDAEYILKKIMFRNNFTIETKLKLAKKLEHIVDSYTKKSLIYAEDCLKHRIITKPEIRVKLSNSNYIVNVRLKNLSVVKL